MAYRISGKILSIDSPQTLTSRSGNPYTKRDLVLTVIKYDQYTGYPTEDPGNTPKFTFFGQRCQDLDGLKVGDTVTVCFDVSGRSYEKDGRTEYLTDVRPVSVYRSNRDIPSAPEPPNPFSQPHSDNGEQSSDPFSAPRSPMIALSLINNSAPTTPL